MSNDAKHNIRIFQTELVENPLRDEDGNDFMIFTIGLPKGSGMGADYECRSANDLRYAISKYDSAVWVKMPIFGNWDVGIVQYDGDNLWRGRQQPLIGFYLVKRTYLKQADVFIEPWLKWLEGTLENFSFEITAADGEVLEYCTGFNTRKEAMEEALETIKYILQ